MYYYNICCQIQNKCQHCLLSFLSLQIACKQNHVFFNEFLWPMVHAEFNITDTNTSIFLLLQRFYWHYNNETEFINVNFVKELCDQYEVKNVLESFMGQCTKVCVMCVGGASVTHPFLYKLHLGVTSRLIFVNDILLCVLFSCLCNWIIKSHWPLLLNCVLF